MASQSRTRGESLAVDVYTRLREAIVTGQYRPNQRLVETELAERLNASRTPVRESLQRLQGEGLVSVYRRGWIVREHTPREIRQIYDVRMALEGYASRLAAQRASPETIDAIKEINDGLTVELAESDRPSFLARHDAFHNAVTQAAGNPMLEELIRVHREHHFNRRVAGLYSREEMKEAVRGHAAIVAALRRGSEQEAEDVTHRHLVQAMEVTLRLMV